MPFLFSYIPYAKKRRWPHGSESGFTLLELSLVLVVLSVLIGGIATVATQEIRRNKKEDIRVKMDAIENALIAYRAKYNRLPCPANTTLLISNEKFGIEAANAGSCTGGNPAANFNDGSQTVAGQVPVRTLNLPDEYAIDPWGGRFLYAVDKRITATNAFSTYKITDTAIGSITVKDASGSNRVTRAVSVLLSFGENGHGAYQASGSRKSTGSTNANEQKNCHCNASAVAGTFDATFVQQAASGGSANALNIFDDAVRYYLRSSLHSASDLK